MVVGVLRLDLRFHGCRSLKAKRGYIRQVQSKIRNTFDVAVAETGSQDLWQRAELGIAAIGCDRAVINQKLDHLINFVESLGTADLMDHKIELINL